jgi:hypothetical protein
MRPILTAALLLSLTPAAHAQAVMYQCKFSERCSEGGCEPMRDTYSFRLDVRSGEGAMIAEGQEYPGMARASETTHTFFFINQAGAEMVTINLEGSGDVVYSGHMGFGDYIGTYRLTGTCLRGAG